jgi:hypothetical protein
MRRATHQLRLFRCLVDFRFEIVKVGIGPEARSEDADMTACTPAPFKVENSGLAFELFLQISGKLVAYVFRLGAHDSLAKGGQTADQADVR